MKEHTNRQPSWFDEISPNIPLRLKQARISADLTQQELASILGCSHSAIAMYESGKRQPSIKFIVDFCRATEINLSWLFGLSSRQILEPGDVDEKDSMIDCIVDYLHRSNESTVRALYILLFEQMFNTKYEECRGMHIPGMAYVPGKVHDETNRVKE